MTWHWFWQHEWVLLDMTHLMRGTELNKTATDVKREGSPVTKLTLRCSGCLHFRQQTIMGHVNIQTASK